jgi:hypothetical protein
MKEEEIILILGMMFANSAGYQSVRLNLGIGAIIPFIFIITSFFFNTWYYVPIAYVLAFIPNLILNVLIGLIFKIPYISFKYFIFNSIATLVCLITYFLV